MNAANFDDLVQQCLSGSAKRRMMYVFVRLSAMDDAAHHAMELNDDEDAVMVQVLFDAHQPAQPGLDFAQVCSVADNHNPAWTLCVVGVAENADGSLPGEVQARAFLAKMREKIMIGDIGDYTILDRDGQAVSVEAESAPPPQASH